jgi:hypothetical protein
LRDPVRRRIEHRTLHHNKGLGTPITQSLLECVDVRLWGSVGAQEPESRDFRRPLRANDEGPAEEPTRDAANERSPIHH